MSAVNPDFMIKEIESLGISESSLVVFSYSKIHREKKIIFNFRSYQLLLAIRIIYLRQNGVSGFQPLIE